MLGEIAATWRPVKGFVGYWVSDDGQIYSRYTKRILRQQLHRRDGYLIIRLRRQTKKVHRLVAEAFVEGYAKNKEVNHKDGVKTNNRASNLEWVTHRENGKHAYKMGLSVRKKTPVFCVTNGIQYESLLAAGKALSLSPSCIRYCILGEQKTTGGYVFRRAS